MAKFFKTGKGRKNAVTALSILLCASLSAGVVSACTSPKEDDNKDDEPAVSATDTQLLKNGNFEFYGEMDESELNDRRAFINSPNNWSFSSGSPSSNTSSGIVNLADWDYMSKSTYKLIPEEKESNPTLTSAIASEAKAHWNEASVYDRLQFYDYYDIDSASEFELYSDYRYSIDFEDLEYLHEVKNIGLYEKEGRPETGDSSVLMIHNKRTSDGVRGTAQYYTSGTTITLNAGTAAKVSLWVRTSELYHYAAGADSAEDVAVTRRAGAYIGVTNTVGGTTLDQMQIKNINTKDEWQQFTVYVRANTFASTTFRIVLGLGQGSSDNRYEAVDGYAFFDDVTCELLSDEAYTTATAALPADNLCGLNDKGDSKKFFATDNATGAQNENRTFALDLRSNEFENFDELFGAAGDVTIGLTEETSGSQTYTSEKIDASLGNGADNLTGVMSLTEIAGTNNEYLKKIYADDFENKFPASFSKENVVLLLSANGAAYTAKLNEISVAPKERLLISFFVKTSQIRTGKTGASAILVDGENKTTISAFDSTTVSTVDIDSNSDDESLKDIYKGWVQCFFFVENTTDEAKAFHLELTYGPTSISGTSKSDYSDGYAAFANFQTLPLTNTQYGYASTGTYAQKVSLTASVKDSSKFDDASANGTQLKDGLALPVNYTGVLAGSNFLTETEKDESGNITNANPNTAALAEQYGIYTGLLSAENAETYMSGTEAWNTALNGAANATNANDWWKNLFGNKQSSANAAYQPLVILNTNTAAQPSYGYFAKSATVNANSATRISVRVKLSEGASAYVYLTDVSDVKNNRDAQLSPNLPTVTYWYDDDGNIVKGDPTAKDYNKKTDILYTFEKNGLYKKVGDESGVYYANLSAFGKADDEGNLVTPGGTIAYYGKDGKFYAYYDKDTDSYSQEVLPLPTDAGVRYTAPATPADYKTAIKVEGTAENADQWVTVSFYVQAGSQAKQYRLELWAGARDNKENGIPAGGYVFFDRLSTSSVSNYSDILGATVDGMKDKLGLGAENKIPNALYYTFTFFDSPEYLRYDESKDTDELGNPWGSYTQSEQTEQLVYLFCDDKDGSTLGTAYPSASLFLSYAANEVTVTPDELGGSDTNDGDDNSTDTTTGDQNPANFWLLLASILLVAALAFAMVVVLIRSAVKKAKQEAAIKQSKKNKKKSPKKSEPSDEE